MLCATILEFYVTMLKGVMNVNLEDEIAKNKYKSDIQVFMKFNC